MAWLETSCPSWPHLFAALDADPHDLLAKLHANHIHCVEGHWVEELKWFARLAGIVFVEA